MFNFFCFPDITQEEDNNEKNCLYVKLWRTGHEYFTEKCDSRRKELRLLCQYEPTADGMLLVMAPKVLTF